MNIRLAFRVTFVATALSAPGPLVSAAAADAILIDSYSQLAIEITPATGTLLFFDPWTASAFAEAVNSQGEFDQEFTTAINGVAEAEALVTWAAGAASALAIGTNTTARSGISIPDCVSANASSVGRGTLSTVFMLLGGVGSATVDFSVDLSSDQVVLTSACAVAASSETIAAVELDGEVLPELFFHSLITRGPNGAADVSVDDHLRAARTLEFGVAYSLFAEVDSESLGTTAVPEPSLTLLLIGGCGLAWRHCRHDRARRESH
jgi:hypothetical protein